MKVIARSAALCLLLAVVLLGSSVAFSEEFLLKSARQIGDIDQVLIVLDATGQVVNEKGKPVDLVLRGEYELHEKLLTQLDGENSLARSVRYYSKAKGSVKIGRAHV